MRRLLDPALRKIRKHNVVTELVLVAFAAAAFAGSVAYGAPGDDPRTVHVSYADLDVSKPAGADALLNRLRTAAARVCNEFGMAAPAVAWRVEKCYETALAKARAQVEKQRALGLHPVARVRAG